MTSTRSERPGTPSPGRSEATVGRGRPRGRPSKGAGRLSRSAIVEAALVEIADAGPAALGMRSVARRLGVDPKSLYNHVDGKDGLLDAVAEHVLATLVLPEPTGDPEADVRSFAHAFRRHARAHPRAASLLLTRRTDSVASLAPIEAVLAMLTDAGLDAADAVHVMRGLLATLIGLILRETDADPSGRCAPVVVARRREALEASGLPHVVAAAEHLAVYDRDREFDRAVDVAARAVAFVLDEARTGRRRS